MKKRIFIAALLLAGICQAQDINKIITESEVARIEKTLSSDAMEGRKTFSPGIEKAADFIAGEMKAAGLQPLTGAKDFLQRFSMIKGEITEATATIDGKLYGRENIACISTNENILLNEKTGYKTVSLKPGSNFIQAVRPYINSKENVLILADTAYASGLKMLQRYLANARFQQENNVVIVLTPLVNATAYTVKIHQHLTEQKLANVTGMIPGKSKPGEYVIFSGHYDHLGYGKPDAKGDSLYNGANDDASGTTAVLLLARYYKQLNNNERTLIFTALTAEEIGGYGSRYFSNQMDPAKVMAMFNIEMIGTESKWGRNSAYITGYEKTDMGKILAKNLKGSSFTFYPDPYTEEQLFYRSDNATLASQGVPAHTISTSKMDNEPNYHQAGDELSTLDMKNMTEIIKSVAISARSIVAGKDSPSRVDTTKLR